MLGVLVISSVQEDSVVIRTLRSHRGLAAIAALLAFSSTYAQWTVTNLHPGAASASYSYATRAGTQGGQVEVGGSLHAALWSGTSGSFVDLNPFAAESSSVQGVAGGQQAGFAVFLSVVQAGIWNGTAGSWSSLHPAGADYSAANATDGTQQVGTTLMAGVIGASLWTGTAGSWVDLNPAGSLQSEAFGVGNGQQVGYMFDGATFRASLWTGTAASWTDLHPSGADASTALAAQGGRQVGWASFGGVQKAGMWSGTAGSWVDLHPSGADASGANAIDDDHQVGFAIIGGASKAGLWKNTAASFVNLHNFLPAEFTDSTATGVYHTPTSTVVSGWGFNSLTSRAEALVWTGPPLVVPYTWSGFLPPINMNGSSIFRKNRVIPVKFKLTGDFSGVTNLHATLYIARVTNGEVGTELAPDNNCGEDEGNVFRYSCGQYIYNLGTRNMDPGTWRLRVDMGDGVERSVLVTIRR